MRGYSLAISLFVTVITLGTQPVSEIASPLVLQVEKDISAIAWSLEGSRIAVGSIDGNIITFGISDEDRFIFTANSELKLNCQTPGKIDALAFDDNARLAFAGCWRFTYDGISPNEVGILDSLNNEKHTFEATRTFNTTLAWNTSERLLAAGGSNGLIYIWDTSSGEKLVTFDVGAKYFRNDSNRIKGVSWRRNSLQLVFGTDSGILQSILFKRDDGRLIRASEFDVSILQLPAITSLDIDSQSQFVVVGHASGLVTVWNIQEPSVYPVCEIALEGPINDVKFRPNTTDFAILYNRSSLDIYSCDGLKYSLFSAQEASTGFASGTPHVAWKSGGSYLAMSTGDIQLWVWNLTGIQ